MGGAPFVKICGITCPEDVPAGADAIGVNFYEGSKRFVRLEDAGEWLERLGGKPARIAVVVNPEPGFVRRLAESGLFEAIQFHGEETPDFCAACGFPVWIKAVAARDAETLEAALAYDTPHLLVDAWCPGERGGTGRVPDWGLVAGFVRAHPERRVLLAGGLNPANVAEAVRVVRPFGVDVASGVEGSDPRRKDPAATAEFVRRAREAAWQ